MDDWIRIALEEDRSQQDITSLACVDESRAVAHILLKQSGWIAGLKFLPQIFSFHDPLITCSLLQEEGSFCKKGTLLAQLSGPARSLLSGERVALNLLQHLSGVATLTARCVQRVKKTKCQILDTRKTLPGLRALQKYAVKIGGGTNHRMDLSDQILIKNNHLALTPSITECVMRAKKTGKKVEIEVNHLDELKEAIEAKADKALLDNMSPSDIRECVRFNEGRIFLEASGGIRLNNIKKYAETGVDGISIGALTHSAPALDICMRIQKRIL